MPLTLPGVTPALSPLCLGAAGLGSKLDRDASFELLDAYVDLGGNFIDTAATYADSQSPVASVSEKTIGQWLRSRKIGDDVVIATKGGCPRPDRFFRLRPEDIRSDLEASLRHLHLDRCPLYWLHRDDPEIPVEVIIDALNEHIRAGKVGAIGCSNWTLARIEEANTYAAKAGLQGFVANQMMWSLADTRKADISDQTLEVMDAELYDYHAEHHWPAVPFSSQAKGFFSGRYRAEDGPPADRAGTIGRYWTATNLARLSQVQELSRELGVPSTAVALAYLLAQPFPVHPIIGASSTAQLTESWAATECTLSQEMLTRLR